MTSTPLSSPSQRSRKITAGSSRSMNSRASRPLFATCTTSPRRAKNRETTIPIISSSSTYSSVAMLPLCASRLACHPSRMLNIDLTGRRALVAGVADDGGFGFAIAKALAEAGASVCVGTWPPALNIFLNLLERGKMDESRLLSDGSLLNFERIYPLDAVFDTYESIPDELRRSKRYRDQGDF